MSNRLRVAFIAAASLVWLFFVLTHFNEMFQAARHLQSGLNAFVESRMPVPQFDGPMSSPEALLFMLVSPVSVVLFTVAWVHVANPKNKTNVLPK